MVSNQALGAICIEVGLHEHLMFESFDLANKIRAYTETLKQKRDAEYELAKKEDRPPGQYWIDATPPKARAYVGYALPTTADFGSRHFQMLSSPSSVQFLFRTTSRPRERKVFSTRFSNHSTTNTSPYVHFLITPPRHCSRCCKPMVVNNSKFRVSLSQQKNFRMERCAVVRLVLAGSELTDKFL